MMRPWLWFGSSRSGVCSGTALILILILLVWLCGIHASLSLGPGGEFPGLYGKACHAKTLPGILCAVSSNGTLFLFLQIFSSTL